MPETLSAALVIAIVVSLIKPFVEARVPRGTPLHDGAIRVCAVLIGVGGELAARAVAGPLTARGAWDAAGAGMLAAITAIATFHLVTASYFSGDGTVLAPAAPAPPPAERTPAATVSLFPPTD